MNLANFIKNGAVYHIGNVTMSAKQVHDIMHTAPDIFALRHKLSDAIRSIDDMRQRRRANKEINIVTRRVGDRWYGPTVNLIGGVHQTPNAILNLYTERQGRVWEEFKSPRSDEFHFGIEIELTTNCNKADLIREASKLNLKQYLQIKRDGSIRPTLDSKEGFELCLCVPESKLHSVMYDMQKLLTAINAKVNNSCGLHIHLDMRQAGNDLAQQWESYLNLKMGQNIIKRSVAKSRHTSKWCRWSTSTDIRSARNASTRYRAINATALRSKNTIEVRAFQGTVDCSDILTYCLMLRKIMLTKNPLKRASNSQATIARIYGREVVNMMCNMERKYNLAS